MASLVKRLVVGRPLSSNRLGETLLPKSLALPIFCSDPISSVAYATEEIVLVLAAGGAAALLLAKWIALAVAALLVIVVASYRQTCFAYPSGGGAYIVSRTNLGETAALTAASALLVDYVMTVAVSVVGGVVAIVSAVPGLASHTVALSVGFVLLIAVVNLRGVKESGKAFAIPTYGFIAGVYLLFVVAAVKGLTHSLPQASTAHDELRATVRTGGSLTVLLALKAFASGCTALTGVEAISNGVPAFRRPKSRNAAATLVIMGALATSMFVGITVLALTLHAHAVASGNPSVISQIAASVFGSRAPLFFYFQAVTAGILVLAANTAFNGFPVLASILAKDGFLPRQLRHRGDRLGFSNGIVALAGFAVVLIVAFDANIDRLIQLYILGVFISFTLSQTGMVRHWQRALADAGGAAERRRIRRAQAINATGGAVTALVLVIVVYSKFTHGAYLVVIAMPILFALMKTVRRHYRRVAAELEPPDGELGQAGAVRGVVLMPNLQTPALRALSYARATRPTSLEALSTAAGADAEQMESAWLARKIPVPLVLVNRERGDLLQLVLEHVAELRRAHPGDVVAVFIPEIAVRHWWEQLLHNQVALRLKARLLFQPGVMVLSVPWELSARRDTLEPPVGADRTKAVSRS
ncbi:MAG: APC family permease [Actinomycetota bacterium]|nr:APC family permease [Actinomycetota bacterium]